MGVWHENFRGKLIHERNLKLKISGQTPGCKFWLLPCNNTYFVHRKNLLSACVNRVHYIIFWFQGAWLCDVASLVMYCNEAPQRIVTKFVKGTALPFSILIAWCQLLFILIGLCKEICPRLGRTSTVSIDITVASVETLVPLRQTLRNDLLSWKLIYFVVNEPSVKSKQK